MGGLGRDQATVSRLDTIAPRASTAPTDQDQETVLVRFREIAGDRTDLLA
jgi:hypothetical protein